MKMRIVIIWLRFRSWWWLFVSLKGREFLEICCSKTLQHCLISRSEWFWKRKGGC